MIIIMKLTSVGWCRISPWQSRSVIVAAHPTNFVLELNLFSHLLNRINSNAIGQSEGVSVAAQVQNQTQGKQSSEENYCVGK